MHRRQVTTGLLASGLAAPPIVGPTSALASQEQDNKDNDPRFAQFAPIKLRVATGLVLVSWFLIFASGNWWGIKLSGEHPQFNENRVGLGGLLGGLTRPTIDERLKNAQLMGALFLMGNSLLMFPTTRRARWNMEIILAHRALSWDPKLAASLVSLGTLTPQAARARSTQIGLVYLVAATTLLLLANPVLNKIYR
ncbi:MAG: hypothetical protein HKP40_00140 [Litoreibacter sp.]|nr:hypothetical protein [Litoreibacter sp.]